ncbi:MAG: hypothetical protein QRY74_02170 [Chlamydia sp.]
MMKTIIQISQWWVRFSLFVICSTFFYAYSIYRLDLEKSPLIKKALFLEMKKEALLDEIHSLEEITGSLFDPSADEYALIMRYGRVPEGSKKIFISSEEACNFP